MKVITSEYIFMARENSEGHNTFEEVITFIDELNTIIFLQNITVQNIYI